MSQTPDSGSKPVYTSKAEGFRPQSEIDALRQIPEPKAKNRTRGTAPPMVAVVKGKWFCIRCNGEVNDDEAGLLHLNKCLWKTLIDVAGTAKAAKELARNFNSPSLESLPAVMSSFVAWRRSLSIEECRDAYAVKQRLLKKGYEVPDEIDQKAKEFNVRRSKPEFERLTGEERLAWRRDAAERARRAHLEASALRAQALPRPEELRAMREASGLSQDELAEMIGVSGSAIWQWEAGKCVPRPNVLNNYLTALSEAQWLLPPVAERASLRKAQGLRQVDVAAKVGVTYAAISLWETGKSRPRTEHLMRRYAEALGWKP